MKYDINSRISKDWDVGHLGNFLSNIKLLIFNIILRNADYMIGRHNLLKNDGIVEHDQKTHSDCPGRSFNTWVILNHIVILLSIFCISNLIVVVVFLIYEE